MWNPRESISIIANSANDSGRRRPQSGRRRPVVPNHADGKRPLHAARPAGGDARARPPMRKRREEEEKAPPAKRAAPRKRGKQPGEDRTRGTQDGRQRRARRGKTDNKKHLNEVWVAARRNEAGVA